MLTKTLKAEIPTDLTIEGQGETVTFGITYHNRTEAELDEVLANKETKVGDSVLFIVKDWEAEYELSIAGLEEAESARPGLVVAIINRFREVRQVAKVKN